MSNPEELARQAAAVMMPTATLGLKFTLSTDNGSDTHDYGPKLAQLFGVSTMQIEHHTSQASEHSMELQVWHLPTPCTLFYTSLSAHFPHDLYLQFIP